MKSMKRGMAVLLAALLMMPAPPARAAGTVDLPVIEAEEDRNLPVTVEDLAVDVSENAAEPDDGIGEVQDSDEDSGTMTNGVDSESVEESGSGNGTEEAPDGIEDAAEENGSGDAADEAEGDGAGDAVDGSEGDGTGNAADGAEGDGTGDAADGAEGDGTGGAADGAEGDGTGDAADGSESDGTGDASDGAEGDGTGNAVDGTGDASEGSAGDGAEEEDSNAVSGSTGEEGDAETDDGALEDSGQGTSDEETDTDSDETTDDSEEDQSEAEERSANPDEEIPEDEEGTAEWDEEGVLFSTGGEHRIVVNPGSPALEEYAEIADVFNEDGSYTIQIPEEDPFFPYEVQFADPAFEKVENVWFMTPDSTVEFGGHTFRVAADFTGRAVTQLSLNIAGDTVIIYPEEKTFGGADSMSLLPLEEVWLNGIDVTGYTPLELTMVSIGSIFTGRVELKDTDRIMWTIFYDARSDYRISQVSDSINLSYARSFQMIVGEPDQLAADNIRYLVRLNTPDSKGWLTPVFYGQDTDGTRAEVEVTRESYSSSSYNGYGTENVTLSSRQGTYNDGYLALKINTENYGNTKFTSVRAFEGQHESVEEALAATEVTDKIFCKDMTQKDAGYWMESDRYSHITLVSFDGQGKVTGCLPVTLYYDNLRSYVSVPYSSLSKADGSYVSYSSSITTIDGCTYYTYKLYPDNPVDAEYAQKLVYYVDDVQDSSVVTAAYVGQYSSIAEAVKANAKDVKDVLFGTGYVGNYSEGIYFTIFVGQDGSERQSIYHYNFKVVEREKTQSLSVQSLRKADGSNVSYSRSYSTMNGCEYYTYELYADYPVNENYSQRLVCYNDGVQDNSVVTAAYVGQYSTIAEAVAANAEDVKDDLFGTEGYIGNYSEGIFFTIFLGEDGTEEQKVYKYNFKVVERAKSYRIDTELPLLKTDGSEASAHYYFDRWDNCVTWELYSGDPVDGQYAQRFVCYADSVQENSAVTAAYVGRYATIAEAVAANAEDVKGDLFGTKGYVGDYSEGIYFTVFIGEDGAEGRKVFQYQVIVKKEDYVDSLNSGTAVEFQGLINGDGEEISCFALQDSYAENNYIVYFVNEDVDLSNLAPTFRISYDSLKLYTEGSTAPEVSGKSYHDFSKGSVQYTASSEDKSHSKNYWVQVVTKEETLGQLFMNSLVDPDVETITKEGVVYTKREVMLDSMHDYKHDIVLANMGAEPIKNLAAELVSDSLELDEYWTLKGDHELAGFTTANRPDDIAFGELSNLAMLRLRRKADVADGADVAGTLTIKSGETVLMVITLTGTVGDPTITTTEVPEAVKYVPYGTMIQSSNKYSWNEVTFGLESGTLPGGMVIKPNGELYGVPTEEGEFTFSVRMHNSHGNFSDRVMAFTLVVKENTNENVDSATDENYELTERVTDVYDSSLGDQTMVSQGEFGEFVDLWLDGVKLEKDVDYEAESGSTRVTIYSQTLGSKETGTHTLGIEFRTSDTDSVRRAAQNYEIETKDDPDTPDNPDDPDDPDDPDTPDDPDDPDTPDTPGGNRPGGNTPGGNRPGGGTSGNGSSSGNSGSAGNSNTSGGSSSNSGTAVPEASTVVESGASSVSYTVERGDTLWKIAVKFYGDGNQWQRIYEDNKNVLSNPNKIYAGQVLVIRLAASAEGTDAAAAGQENGAAANPAAGGTYTVQRGDSLWKIAVKVYGNGRRWREIYEANADRLSDASRIYAGQVLVIPE